MQDKRLSHLMDAVEAAGGTISIDFEMVPTIIEITNREGLTMYAGWPLDDEGITNLEHTLAMDLGIIANIEPELIDLNERRMMRRSPSVEQLESQL